MKTKTTSVPKNKPMHPAIDPPLLDKSLYDINHRSDKAKARALLFYTQILLHEKGGVDVVVPFGLYRRFDLAEIVEEAAEEFSPTEIKRWIGLLEDSTQRLRDALARKSVNP